jgi:protein phosphatase
LLRVEPVALTDVGRKRSTNQDYLGDLIFKSGRSFGQEKLDQRGHLFAVADGMGGYAGGEVASELAITTLFERFYNGPTSGDIASDLSEAIRLANSQVHDTAATSGRPQMGTTLTSVLLHGNKAIFGNVGDSRTYLIRQGIPERVTHDHSLVQDQIDAGVLTPEQAERSSIKNFITRAIGHRNEVESDLFEREIEAGDVLLLCSDGLHGPVKEMEMGTIVATTPKLKDSAQQLLDLALERGGRDNISVMLVRVLETGDPLPPILDGRKAKFNTNEHLYSQVTKEIPLVSAGNDYNYTTVAMSEQLTAPMKAGTVPVVPSTVEEHAAVPLTTPTPERPRTGGKGLLVGLLLLLALVGCVALAYVLLSGSTPALTPRTVPIGTPTITSFSAPTSAAFYQTLPC